MEEENKLRQTDNQADSLSIDFGVDLEFGTAREEILEAQYKIMLWQVWLERYYYGGLGNELFVSHFFEMSDIYDGQTMEDIINCAIEKLKGIFENYVSANIDNGNSFKTIRAKLVDIIEFVPLIFGSMRKGTAFFEYDLSEALLRWRKHILKETPKVSLPSLKIIVGLSKKRLNKQWLSPEYPLKPSTIRRKMQSVKSFCIFLNRFYGFHFGCHQSFPDFNKPINKRSNKSGIISLDIEDIVKKIPVGREQSKAFIGYRDKAIILTLSKLGLTVSELIDLNANDIDLDNYRIIVRRGTEREHKIIITDKSVLMAMRKYADLCRNIYPTSTKLFLSAKGESISRISVFKIVKERAEQSGYSYINPQMLREARKRELMCEKRKSEAARILGVKRLYNRDL